MFDQIREDLYLCLYGYKEELPEDLSHLTISESGELIEIVIANLKGLALSNGHTESELKELNKYSKLLLKLNEKRSPCLKHIPHIS